VLRRAAGDSVAPDPGGLIGHGRIGLKVIFGMHESSSVPRVPAVKLPLPGTIPDHGSADGRPADTPETTLRLNEDHDRIATGLNDIVVHRLFAAGLDLESALALAGTDHPAAAKIEHAIGQLDQAISDLRSAVFTRPQLDLPGPD
jgi:Histidine kinase